MTKVCIFCFNSPPIGLECSYDFHHEYAEDALEKQQAQRQKQVAKPDTRKCLKCGLHIKNPSSLTNGCEHIYLVSS